MLSIQHLSKTYPGGTHALQGIDLTVTEGEVVAIVGGSGCGKSTLLRIAAGLDRPSLGRVVIDGSDVVGPHPKIGIVFQEPRLFPWMTVAQNVGFGLTHLARPDREARVTDALARVGLSDKATVWPRQLSGGQAQRVAIARALVARPEVLLLDEPFSALDAFTRLDQQRHLLQIWASVDPRPTLVIVTHDVDEALLLADRVIVMRPNPGRIADDIPVDLPRPRDRTAPAFEIQRRAVMAVLDRTLPHIAVA
ncbi:MAG: ABC transporter ATP-binding protein [Paracoccus sp. (in: a-proteobacteria)]